MNSARITPRIGAPIYRVSVEHYGAFWAGQYRGSRDVWLVVARNTADHGHRAARIRLAIRDHRSMMRCLRELRREQRLRVAA